MVQWLRLRLLMQVRSLVAFELDCKDRTWVGRGTHPRKHEHSGQKQRLGARIRGEEKLVEGGGSLSVGPAQLQQQSHLE